ncbi:MAG: peptide-methionine (S)-S-oxide reductase MsrA [Armatimonadota bacterium]|nr:MAG: peptide-methionine (S)-S-oxide reductase MsrA [Armatimonadota bacterium]
MHTANSRDNLETATFAAGCFWGVEQAFRRVKGVMSTSVGYTGGDVEKPTYERVCSGTTGHSEAVHVTFDPEQVTYDELLDVFWGLHDPSRKAGRQYRSAIFFHSPEQEAAATASKAKLEESGKYKGQIATEILPAERFWRAEEYHQQYLEKRNL